MFFVYVHYSKTHEHKYVGFTKDLKKRIKRHQNNEVKSTSQRNMSLIFYEAYLSEEDARRREVYFKST